MEIDVAYLGSENWDAQMTERLRWLRENDPVRWSEQDDLWLVTKYEDVAYVSKHQELFTSALGVRPSNPAKIGLIDEAEPRHTQLRSLINRGFTPRMVQEARDGVPRRSSTSRSTRSPRAASATSSRRSPCRSRSS